MFTGLVDHFIYNSAYALVSFFIATLLHPPSLSSCCLMLVVVLSETLGNTCRKYIQYLTVISGDRGDAGEVTEKAAKPVTTVQDWGSTFVSMTQDIFKECLRTIPSRVCINHNRYFVPNTWCFLNLNQAVFMLKPNQSISTGHKIKLKGFNISMVCRNTNYLHFFWWLGHIYSILRRLTPSLMSKAWWAFG